MVLHHAAVQHEPSTYKDGKYAYYFTVESPMGRWRLRADTASDADMWVQALQAAAGAPPVILSIKQAEELEANVLKTNRRGPLKAVREQDSFASIASDPQSGSGPQRSEDASNHDVTASSQDYAEYLQLDGDQAKRYVCTKYACV
eukprot:TRINITY_DN3917_c0_g1_i9.p2 TRINITY_DN3917_c0_g1~~TRINITY_DN3917_c0_g1_i9.p2  ORF type:complete len:145 (-),score=42.28 TRINITY_DN3917_c0_g1_i9:461-895(-)